MDKKRMEQMFKDMSEAYLEIEKTQARRYYSSRKRKMRHLNKQKILSSMTVTQVIPTV